jgi:hypothetical protein
MALDIRDRANGDDSAARTATAWTGFFVASPAGSTVSTRPPPRTRSAGCQGGSSIRHSAAPTHQLCFQVDENPVPPEVNPLVNALAVFEVVRMSNR